RNARDEPRLLQKLACLKRPAERELDRVGAHREKPTGSLHRTGETVGQADPGGPALRPVSRHGSLPFSRWFLHLVRVRWRPRAGRDGHLPHLEASGDYAPYRVRRESKLTPEGPPI